REIGKSDLLRIWCCGVCRGQEVPLGVPLATLHPKCILEFEEFFHFVLANPKEGSSCHNLRLVQTRIVSDDCLDLLQGVGSGLGWPARLCRDFEPQALDVPDQPCGGWVESGFEWLQGEG